MEETLQVTCPSCAKTMKVQPALVGRKVRCKGCASVFRVLQGGKTVAVDVDSKPASSEKASPAPSSLPDTEPAPARRKNRALAIAVAAAVAAMGGGTWFALHHRPLTGNVSMAANAPAMNLPLADNGFFAPGTIKLEARIIR